MPLSENRSSFHTWVVPIQHIVKCKSDSTQTVLTRPFHFVSNLLPSHFPGIKVHILRMVVVIKNRVFLYMFYKFDVSFFGEHFSVELRPAFGSECTGRQRRVASRRFSVDDRFPLANLMFLFHLVRFTLKYIKDPYTNTFQTSIHWYINLK